MTRTNKSPPEVFEAVKDEDRQRLRRLLLAGAASPQAVPADEAYFAGLRERIRARKTQAAVEAPEGGAA
jgi:hypothetical protein